MTMALWAKSAVGTNLSFIKGFGKAIKSWREILQQALYKKPVKPQPRLERVHVFQREKHFQPHCQGKTSDSLTSRVFKSLISSSTAKLLSRDLVMRTRNRFRARGLPLFSLIGISLGFDVQSLMDNGSQNTLMDIKESLESYSWAPESLHKSPHCLEDLQINTQQSLACGCEGVVYEAKVKDESDILSKNSESYDLALKAVFNYGAESNASSIVRNLGREMIPLQSLPVGHVEDGDEIPQPAVHLPPHPNIVEMPSMFIDNVLVTEEGLRKFPAALPYQNDPSQCCGRNKTMYLVMKKTTNNLRSYLAENPEISMATRCFLLAQLLEGVAHLTSHGIAHRDLKSNNLLIDLPGSTAWPRLEICDFGCCLAEKDKKLSIPFFSLDSYPVGNDWLMAPEIRTAKPGPESYLNFEKSDLWAVGAIAYEILGARNPFYPSPDHPDRQLKNTMYREEELPPLSDEVPGPIKQLVKSLLMRDPNKRPSACLAATVVQMVLLSFGKNGYKQTKKKFRKPGSFRRQIGRSHRYLPLTKEELLFQRIWTQSLALFCYLKFKKASHRESMKSVNSFVFLSRLTYPEFKAALKYF